MSVRDAGVFCQDPSWNYQIPTVEKTNPDILGKVHMITCLLAGLEKASHKMENFDKLHEVNQVKNKNPAQFLTRLTRVLIRYTHYDPDSHEGILMLNHHFILQSAPYIRNKLRPLEKDPATLQGRFA